MIPDVILRIIFILFSLFIAICDYKTETVPRIAFIIILPVLIIMSVISNTATWSIINGAVTGLIIFFIIYLFTGKKLGLADVWYSGIIGLVLGPVLWHIAIILACILGVLYIIISKRSKIPFIPCMAIGGIAVSFFR